MARTKKTDAIDDTKVTETIAETKAKTEGAETVEIPSNVEKLMKLYPHYESFYVTPAGFVHPVEAPKYLTKDATLYKNKYFK